MDRRDLVNREFQIRSTVRITVMHNCFAHVMFQLSDGYGNTLFRSLLERKRILGEKSIASGGSCVLRAREKSSDVSMYRTIGC